MNSRGKEIDVQMYNDFMLLWNTINSPMKAGHKWCQYTRSSIDDALTALKRRMTDVGFKYGEEAQDGHNS